MPEQLNYDAENDLIRIRAWGHNTIDEWIASRQEAVRLHGIHGVSRLLVDARQQVSTPSLFDIFDFGDDWPSQIRVAIMISRDTPEDVMLLETAAVSRGKKLHIFYDEKEALDWLRD